MVGQTGPKPVIVFETNSADTTTTQTDISTTRVLKERRHPPVKLIDVLDVAEEGADLLGFEGQVATVNNAAKIVLRERESKKD